MSNPAESTTISCLKAFLIAFLAQDRAQIDTWAQRFFAAHMSDVDYPSVLSFAGESPQDLENGTTDITFEECPQTYVADFAFFRTLGWALLAQLGYQIDTGPWEDSFTIYGISKNGRSQWVGLMWGISQEVAFRIIIGDSLEEIDEICTQHQLSAEAAG